MIQLPVVAARDLPDAEIRQLQEVAAAVEPAADGTPVTTDLDAYASTKRWKILGPSDCIRKTWASLFFDQASDLEAPLSE